ncbi:MAG: prepilin-type N-terminal cleavage/methylation domain-containing protein [Verrucomicrobia bacterium]|nr:prepilin-type N-terminal cleavage/methylation domain-containing protein [Verrucomicrobiota bacterium]
MRTLKQLCDTGRTSGVGRGSMTGMPPAVPQPPESLTALRAFTLIELLAAITILMLIVSMLVTIFAQSDRAWRVGTGRADTNTEGRAAINAIVQDLEYAVADDLISFIMRPDVERPEGDNISYSYTNSEISFVSMLENASPQKRNAEEVHYWVRPSTTDDGNIAAKSLGRYQLMRTKVNTYEKPLAGAPKDRKAYNNQLSGSSAWYMRNGDNGGRNNETNRGVLAENITALAFYAPPATSGGPPRLTYDSTDAANSNQLPLYVDVVLELLSDEDAQRAAQLESRAAQSGNPQLKQQMVNFVDKNSRRYTTRVYFQNRAGYRKRP